jgi:hypothetical protein
LPRAYTVAAAIKSGRVNCRNHNHNQTGDIYPGLVLWPHRLHEIHDIGGFRPDGVVGMHISASDDTFPIDDKPSGHGQFPGVAAIESLEIDAEPEVYLLEFFREGENKVELIRISIVHVRQYRERKIMLFHHLFCIFIQLGGNGDE